MKEEVVEILLRAATGRDRVFSRSFAGVKEAALFGKGMHAVVDAGAGGGPAAPASRSLEAEGFPGRADRKDRSVAGGRLRFPDGGAGPAGEAPERRCDDEPPARSGRGAQGVPPHPPRPAQPGHGDRHPHADAAAVRLCPDAGRGQRADRGLGPERSPESRELVSRFEGSRYFDVRLRAERISRTSSGRSMAGQVLAAVVIPRAFYRSPGGAGHGAAVQFLVDGSDSNTATIAIGYAEAVSPRVLAGHRCPGSEGRRHGDSCATRWKCAPGSGSTRTWSRRTTSSPG